MKQIKEKVVDLLKSSNSEIVDIIAGEEAKAEITKRVDWTKKGIAEMETITKEIKTIEDNNYTLDASGNKVLGTYTPQKFAELKKKKERLTSVEKALIAGLDTNDFEPLNKLYGKQQQPQQGKGEEGTTSEK